MTWKAQERLLQSCFSHTHISNRGGGSGEEATFGQKKNLRREKTVEEGDVGELKELQERKQ